MWFTSTDYRSCDITITNMKQKKMKMFCYMSSFHSGSLDFYHEVSIYLSIYSASPQILYHIRSALQYSLVQGLSVFHSFVRRSHLLPDQLPGEHTGAMAAVSTLLLQRNNLGKHTMFLHWPNCTSYNPTIR